MNYKLNKKYNLTILSEFIKNKLLPLNYKGSFNCVNLSDNNYSEINFQSTYKSDGSENINNLDVIPSKDVLMEGYSEFESNYLLNIEQVKQAKIDAKASALAKLSALGLTEEEVKSIL
jgi:hypothetical protein